MKQRLIFMLAASAPGFVALPAAAQYFSNPEALDQLDGSPDVRQRFANDLKAGLIAARLDPADINFVLEPLIEARIVRKVTAPPAPPQRHSESLEVISNRGLALIKLRAKLRTRYGIVDPHSAGDVFRIDDDEGPKYPPALRSWLNLQNNMVIDIFPVARARFAEPRPEPEPLKWIAPLRIAATGDAMHDRAVEAALTRLRAAGSNLPIDDASFPAPMERANLFVEGRGIACPAGGPCHPRPPGRILQQAQAALAIEGTWPQLEPLFFFDTLRGGRWFAGAPVYRFKAEFGAQSASVAWVRTDGRGHIGTAYCKGVFGPGTSGGYFFGENGARLPLTFEMISGAIEICIAAAMGAPSGPTFSWFNRDQGDALDQNAELLRLYGRRPPTPSADTPSGRSSSPAPGTAAKTRR